MGDVCICYRCKVQFFYAVISSKFDSFQTHLQTCCLQPANMIDVGKLSSLVCYLNSSCMYLFNTIKDVGKHNDDEYHDTPIKEFRILNGH